MDRYANSSLYGALVKRRTTVFSEDIQIKSRIDKCAALSIHHGKIQKLDGIELKIGNIMKSLPSYGNYKYLGILEADNVVHTKVKEWTEREYIKRLRKILKSKFNGGNIIKAINTWAAPVIRYSAGLKTN